MEEKLIVDGFIFKSKREYEKAKKEYETIQELKKNIDINNQDNVIEIYNRLISKKFFQTPVGFSFLHEMREFLKDGSDNVSVPYIPVIPMKIVRTEAEQKSQYVELQNEYNRQRVIKNRLILAIVSMTIVIAGMIFIVATNKNLGYFNAEEKVLDKYSAWEERLKSWEEQLMIREDKINELEQEKEE